MGQWAEKTGIGHVWSRDSEQYFVFGWNAIRYRTACDFRRTAATMSTLKCVVCPAELFRSSSRRRLTSDSTKHINPVLREIGHCVFSTVNELLPETNDMCLCHSCFSDSEKLIRLR